MNEDWTAVRIKRARLDDINKMVKAKKSKDITNASDFVDKAVSDLLEKFELKCFEHFNFHDNIIRVLDNNIGTRGDIVELRKHNHSLSCDYCESLDCVHIKFVWSDLKLSPELKKAGIKSPF